MLALTAISSLPVALPRPNILGRLGYQDGTSHSDARIEADMTKAFGLCHPRGVYATVSIQAGNDLVTLPDGWVIHCPGVAKMLASSQFAWLAACTIGPELPQAAAAAMQAGRGASAATYDAVGSETADAAMDALQNLARQQLLPRGLALARCRFSPGYGGWSLADQRYFFDWLQMHTLGVTLTPSFIFSPEKTVTAIAPLG